MASNLFRPHFGVCTRITSLRFQVTLGVDRWYGGGGGGGKLLIPCRVYIFINFSRYHDDMTYCQCLKPILPNRCSQFLPAVSTWTRTKENMIMYNLWIINCAFIDEAYAGDTVKYATQMPSAIQQYVLIGENKCVVPRLATPFDMLIFVGYWPEDILFNTCVLYIIHPWGLTIFIVRSRCGSHFAANNSRKTSHISGEVWGVVRGRKF